MDWNCRDRFRSYVPDLFDRRRHNLVLVPLQNAGVNNESTFKGEVIKQMVGTQARGSEVTRRKNALPTAVNGI